MTTVIEVENLSKYYRLGLIGGGTLQEDFRRWTAKIQGKPDPTLPIGIENHGSQKNDRIWALRDVNLEVKEGEVLGIIGRNGAGKSTLLKILSKITAPTKGIIKIKGRVGSLLEVGTGFHPELTGRENIYLNGTILGMTRIEVARKLDEIIEFSEMLKFIDTPVKRYSSGMTVRLAFAVAAHLEPEILIVDEVLAVGDFAFQKKCLGKMEDVARHGRTVLFVSHNLASIRNLTTRAILLEKGILHSQGNTPNVVQSYLAHMRNQSSIKSIKDRTDREGSGKARVTELMIMDSDSHKNVLPLSPQKKTIVIDVQCIDNVTISRVAVGFYSSEQTRILWLDSSALIPPITMQSGDYRIEVELIEGFSLAPGDYYINLALLSHNEMVDYLPDATKLVIEESDFYGTGKLPASGAAIHVQQKWSLKRLT